MNRDPDIDLLAAAQVPYLDGDSDEAIQVSVIVPTYRRPQLLQRCLRALLEQSIASCRYEIIVADDAPQTQVRALVQRLAACSTTALCYLAVTRTQGPAGARNAAARLARGAILAFTDDDTVADVHWLAEGIAALDGGDAAAAAGAIRMPIPHRPRDFERDAAGLSRAEFATANCFVTRSAFEAVGGFDPHFTRAWREDSDLHFRLLSAGYPVIRAPRAQVLHPVRPEPFGVSIRQQSKVYFDALLYRKHPQLYRRHIRRRPPWDYYIATVSLLAGVGAAVWHSAALAALLLAPWAVLSLCFAVHRLRGTSHAWDHVLEMMLTSAAIAPLSVFWRLRGAWRFRVPFL